MPIPTTKRTRPVFPFRSPAGGAQPKLPACRAWRVIARPALDFAAGQTAVGAGAIPVAPADCLPGSYPVWVQLTDAGGQALGSRLLVDGDGWNLAPTGPDWLIEFVGGVGPYSDRFAYVVETVQDVDECGQVNGAPGAATFTPSRFIVPPTQRIPWSNHTPPEDPLVFRFMRPLGATRADLLFGPVTGSSRPNLTTRIGDGLGHWTAKTNVGTAPLDQVYRLGQWGLTLDSVTTVGGYGGALHQKIQAAPPPVVEVFMDCVYDTLFPDGDGWLLEMVWG